MPINVAGNRLRYDGTTTLGHWQAAWATVQVRVGGNGVYACAYIL